MEENTKAKFGFVINKYKPEYHMWSFGICLSHWEDETYLYINFFRWSMSIGKIIKSEEEEE